MKEEEGRRKERGEAVGELRSEIGLFYRMAAIRDLQLKRIPVQRVSTLLNSHDWGLSGAETHITVKLVLEITLALSTQPSVLSISVV
jgi:hypothetical protein